MRIFMLTLWLFFGVGFAQGNGQNNQPLTPEIIQAVVSVQAYDNALGLPLAQWGTGNIISSNGYILTNFHVAADDFAQPYPYFIIAVTDPNDVSRAPVDTYWAEFVAGVEETDLALLQIISDIEGNPLRRAFQPLELGDASDLFLGDSLRVIGYPGVGGDTITFTTGSFSGWLGENLDYEGRRWIKTDSKISSGNSGGTTLDSNNLLVGIPTAVYTSRSGGEFQAYLRPINLAFPLLTRFEAQLEGLRLPSQLVDVYGEPFSAVNGRRNRLEGEVLHTAAEPPSPLRPLTQVNAQHPLQVLQLEDAVDSIIIGRGVEEDITYHDYIVPLPRDFSQRLFVYADGKLRDVDLAVRFNEEIEDIDKTDYLDVSNDLNSLMVLEAEDFEDVQQVYLRVMNYFRTPLPYNLRVTTEPFTTVDREQVREVNGSRVFGLVTLEDTYIASIAAAEQSDIVYHTYGLLVGDDVPSFTVRVSSDNDIDLAVNRDAPMSDYADADFFDDDDAVEAEYRIDNPRGGLYYVDVINFLDQESQYTIEFNLNDAPLNNDNDEVLASGGDLGFVAEIDAGEAARGRLRGYDDGAGYHIYTVDVPEGTARLEVKVVAEDDLDLALSFGNELPDYTLPEDGGEMDGYDFGEGNNSSVVIRNPEAGTWYLEVINFTTDATEIPYTLTASLR